MPCSRGNHNDLYQSLNIPLALSEKIAQNGNLRPYKVYIALKFVAEGGQIRKSELDLNKVAELAGYSSLSSIYSHLETSLEKNWIGTDGQWYFIRSFDRLRAEYGAESRTSVEIAPDNVNELREFLLGAKSNHYIRSKKHVLKIGSTKPTQKEPFSCLHAPEKSHQPNHISCSMIGKWFGVSAPTASRMKQRAQQAGYLSYHSRLNKLHIPVEDVGNVREATAPATHLTSYQLSHEDYQSLPIERQRKMTPGWKCLAIRLTDAFTFVDNEHEYKYATRCSI